MELKENTERVMHRIVEWTREIAEIRRTRNGQRALYLPEDWTDRREDVLEDEEQHYNADAVVSRVR